MTARLPLVAVGGLLLGTTVTLAPVATANEAACDNQLQRQGGTVTPVAGFNGGGTVGPVLLTSSPDQQGSGQGLTELGNHTGTVTWSHTTEGLPWIIAGGRLSRGRVGSLGFVVSADCAAVHVEGRGVAGESTASITVHTLRPSGTLAPNVVSLVAGDPGTGIPAAAIETRVRPGNPIVSAPGGAADRIDGGTYTSEGRDVTDTAARAGTVLLVEPSSGRVVLRRDYQGLRGPGPIGAFSGTGSTARYVLAMGGPLSATSADVPTDVYGYRGGRVGWHRIVPMLEDAWMTREAALGPVFATFSPSPTAGTNVSGIVANDTRLVALDRGTGRTVWTRDYPGALPTLYEQAGNLLVNVPLDPSTGTSRIDRLDGMTGKTLFSVQGEGILAVADITGDHVPDAITSDGYVDGATGKVVTYLSLLDADYVIPVPDVASDGGYDLLVYRESDNGATAGTLLDVLSLVDGRTGALLWTVPTPHVTSRDGTAAVQGTVLDLGQGWRDLVLWRANPRTITAYRESTGAVDWTTDLGGGA